MMEFARHWTELAVSGDKVWSRLLSTNRRQPKISSKDSLRLYLQSRLESDSTLLGHTRETLTKVANGDIAVLEGNNNFRFQCTGCGECCRSFASSLLLSPHDMWRITTSKALQRAGLGSTTLLGRYLGGLQINPGDQWGLPVCNIKLTLATGQPGHGIDQRCPFAIAVKGRCNTWGKPSLVCALGQNHMPTKCLGFPLSRGVDEAEGFFFVLPDCEGLGQGFEERPLTNYLRSNELEKCWEASDWFKQLWTKVSQAFSSSRIVPSPQVEGRTFNLLSAYWFDFDAVDKIEGESSWPITMQNIEHNTNQVLEAVSEVGQRLAEHTNISSQLSWDLYRAATNNLLKKLT